jgi:hypothetical protein
VPIQRRSVIGFMLIGWALLFSLLGGVLVFLPEQSVASQYKVLAFGLGIFLLILALAILFEVKATWVGRLVGVVGFVAGCIFAWVSFLGNNVKGILYGGLLALLMVYFIIYGKPPRRLLKR